MHHFYYKDGRVDTKKIIDTIISLVEKERPMTYQIELLGAIFSCLITEKVSEEQFKEFVIRQTKDVFLRHERNLLDDMSVFLHWLKHHDFKQKSYQRLMVAFSQSDYSFFDKESRASLKSVIAEMILEMDSLMKQGRNRDEEWLLELESTTKKYEPKSNVKQWVVPEELESFNNHRLHLQKSYLYMEIESKFPVLPK